MKNGGRTETYLNPSEVAGRAGRRWRELLRAIEGEAAAHQCQVATAWEIYALGEGFYQLGKFAKFGCQSVGGNLFLFCQKFVDANLICQTLGDALTCSFEMEIWKRKLHSIVSRL